MRPALDSLSLTENMVGYQDHYLEWLNLCSPLTTLSINDSSDCFYANIPIHLDLLGRPQVLKRFQECSTHGLPKGVPPFFLTLKDAHHSPSDRPPISDERLLGLCSELAPMSIFLAVIPQVSWWSSGGTSGAAVRELYIAHETPNENSEKRKRKHSRAPNTMSGAAA